MSDTPVRQRVDRSRRRNYIILGQFKLAAEMRESQIDRLKKMLVELEGASGSDDPIAYAIELATGTGTYLPGPKARAIVRELERRKDLLEQCGGTFSQAQVTCLLGIDRYTVGRLVTEGVILAVPAQRGRRYPAFQFTSDGQLIDGLREVSNALQATDPFLVLHFLCAPNDELGGEKPIDVLTQGTVAATVEAARHWRQPNTI